MTQFHYEKVKDPLFFKENVLSAHSAHEIFRNREEASVGRNSLRMLLDGVWKFSYALNQAAAPVGFEKEEYDCKCWESICVPAHIQMEGYDVPQYANVQYPWDGREELEPGEIPVRFNPTASYVKYFEVPQEMKGKTIRISFQGVESGMALWLNGSYVGYSEDSFTPSEFDLTPFLKEGENKLAVQVYKWTSSSWCEDQDFFRFSGIYRSVYLYAVPSVHIEDIRVKTLFEEQDFDEAVLEVRTKAVGSGSIRYRLKDGEQVLFEREDKIVSGEQTETVSIKNAPQGSRLQEAVSGLGAGKIEFQESVQAPKLWSAEQPYLYEL